MKVISLKSLKTQMKILGLKSSLQLIYRLKYHLTNEKTVITHNDKKLGITEHVIYKLTTCDLFIEIDEIFYVPIEYGVESPCLDFAGNEHRVFPGVP